MAQMLDQATDIVGVRLEPAVVVLRALELAVREAAPVIADHGVLRRQVLRHGSERVGGAVGPRDHE
jgi:hypothetical protein